MGNLNDNKNMEVRYQIYKSMEIEAIEEEIGKLYWFWYGVNMHGDKLMIGYNCTCLF